MITSNERLDLQGVIGKYIKQAFISKLRECPREHMKKYWDLPMIGGPIFDLKFANEECLVSYANMAIELSTGGGLYHFEEVEYDDVKTDFTFIYSGKDGSSTLRETLNQLYL